MNHPPFPFNQATHCGMLEEGKMTSNLMPSPSVDAHHQQGQSRSLVGAIGHRPGRSNWLTFDSLIILQKTLSGHQFKSFLFQNCLNFGGRSDEVMISHPLWKSWHFRCYSILDCSQIRNGMRNGELNKHRTCL